MPTTTSRSSTTTPMRLRTDAMPGSPAVPELSQHWTGPVSHWLPGRSVPVGRAGMDSVIVGIIDVGMMVGMMEVGMMVGSPSGIEVGRSVGIPVGREIGRSVGIPVGREVGSSVGIPDGREIGRSVGIPVGSSVGIPDGREVGRSVGIPLGREMGRSVGIPVGREVGRSVGRTVGMIVGIRPSPRGAATTEAARAIRKNELSLITISSNIQLVVTDCYQHGEQAFYTIPRIREVHLSSHILLQNCRPPKLWAQTGKKMSITMRGRTGKMLQAQGRFIPRIPRA